MSDFNEYSTIIPAIGMVVSVLFNLFLLVVTAIFYFKRKGVGSLIMLIGLLLMLLQTIANPMLMAFMAHKGSQELANYAIISSVLWLFPYMVFGIGLAIHLISHMKKTQH